MLKDIDDRIIQGALGKIADAARGIQQGAGNIQQGFNNFFNSSSNYTFKVRDPKNEVLRFNDEGAVLGGTSPTGPSATPLPTPTPAPIQQPAGNDGFIFDYNQLPRDQYYAQHGPRPNFQPQQPPPHIGSIIREVFPNEATRAAGLAVTENSQFDPKRKDAINYDKKTGQELSRDRGLFQINNNTFAAEMSKFGDKLRGMGINSYEDMYDARKNALFAKHLHETYGAGRWFGWQDTGYDLKGGWFSAPLRGLYAEYKKTMSPEKALKKAKEELGIK